MARRSWETFKVSVFVKIVLKLFLSFYNFYSLVMIFDRNYMSGIFEIICKYNYISSSFYDLSVYLMKKLILHVF